MPVQIDGLAARIRARVVGKLDSEGAIAVDQIRQAISVPVEYRDNGDVIRSSPGEPPRMETGELYRGIEYVILDEATNPRLQVISARAGDDPNVPRRLEGSLDRPYISTWFDEAKTRMTADGLL